MKLIIQEEQIKHIIQEENIRILLENVIMEYNSYDYNYNLEQREKIKLKVLKRKIKNLILAGMTTAAIFGAISRLGISDNEKEELNNFVKTEQQVDTIFQEKVKACREYMNYALKNQGYTFDNTELTPDSLVRAAIKNSFDLPFLLAAAHLESCFGANSRAKTTNSVFSKGCYDNGKNYCVYNHPNESIDSYINLIQNDYLFNNRTINDLLKKKSFVNKSGLRYAKNPHYERDLKQVRNRIIRMFPILNK